MRCPARASDGEQCPNKTTVLIGMACGGCGVNLTSELCDRCYGQLPLPHQCCAACRSPQITISEPVRLPYAQQDCCVGGADTYEQCAGALNTMNAGCRCGLQRKTIVICDVHAETACRFAYALLCPDCEATVELSEPVAL